MGQFSWLDCISREQILDNVCRDVYVLVPKEFGGGHILETCYDGYGNFGGHDIFDLVADWNRSFIRVILNELRPCWTGRINADEKDLMAFANGDPISCEKRILGIDLACYDEDNARLKYPIKITHDPDAVYEQCGPSDGDPHQGWPAESDHDVITIQFIDDGDTVWISSEADPIGLEMPSGTNADKAMVSALLEYLGYDSDACLNM